MTAHLKSLPYMKRGMVICLLLSLLLVSPPQVRAEVAAAYLDPPNNAQWMTQIADQIKDKKLTTVFLPGTHDAGSYSFDAFSDMAPESCDQEGIGEFVADIRDQCYVYEACSGEKKYYTKINNVDISLDCQYVCGAPNWAGLVATPWAKTQNYNLYNQLVHGIRYFDLRFFKGTDGRYYIHHALKGASREQIFDQILTFVNANPKEIIVLELSHWCEMEDIDHQVFLNYLQQNLGSLLIPRTDIDKTLQEIWATGRRVVVVYRGIDDLPMPTGVDRESFWVTVTSDFFGDITLEDLYDTLTGSLENRKTPDSLFLLQGIYGNNTDAIIDGSLCGPLVNWIPGVKLICNSMDPTPPLSLEEIASVNTPKVTRWVDRWHQNCSFHAPTRLNIVMVDFYEKSNLVEMIKEINQRLPAQDNIGPIVNYSITGGAMQSGWYTSAPVTAAISSVDDGACGSQVGLRQYRLGEGIWSEYTTPIVFNVDGLHTVTFAAQDKKGNRTEIDVQVKIDTQGPVGNLRLNEGDPTAYGSLLRMDYACSDPASGVDRVRLREAGGAWGAWTPVVAPDWWQLPSPVFGKAYTVEAEYQDRAGNLSPVSSAAIILSPYFGRRSSPNYRLQKSTLSASGYSISSADYSLSATLGQPSVTGVINSPEYTLWSGYWTLLVDEYPLYLPLTRKNP